MRQIHEDEAADYAEQMAIERYSKRKMPRNTDPYYPTSYYLQDMMDDAAPADGLADSVES
jgi:hypothetical protein